jgi:archaellin
MSMFEETMKIDDCRADVGASILILFIATILITGIVVTALTGTTNMFVNKATKTGEESKERVATGITIISVSGKMTGDGISSFGILIEPITGSGIITIDALVIRVSVDGRTPVFLRYNKTSDSCGDGFFNVSRWIRIEGDAADRVDDPYIEYGDMIEIGIDTTASASDFSPNTEITILLLLEEGFDARTEFRTPLTYVSGEYVELHG